MVALRLLISMLLVASMFAAESRTTPRGKPIRPVEGVSTQNVVRLPGGVVITNVPDEFLPRTTNIVRLPSAAARKFQPMGYHPTSFTELARFFITPEQFTNAPTRWEELRKKIPEDVLALNGKKVALAGFTLPIALKDGRATEFLLLRSQAACCFGMVPRVNELVMVKMAPPGMKPILDVPVVVGGTLSVKWIGEDQLTAIYEMQADKVERAE